MHRDDFDSHAIQLRSPNIWKINDTRKRRDIARIRQVCKSSIPSIRREHGTRPQKKKSIHACRIQIVIVNKYIYTLNTQTNDTQKHPVHSFIPHPHCRFRYYLDSVHLLRHPSFADEIAKNEECSRTRESWPWLVPVAVWSFRTCSFRRD